MCWGVTLRSPHPHARIRRIDITQALTVPGVWAVLTADDVPGDNAFGLEHADQPVLASEFVRYEGEPVALVAADHPETARRAAARIAVDYEVLPAVTDPRRAMDADAPPVHHPGNLVRHLKLRRGEENPTAPVVVSLDFEVGMQDQAFLGPESGLAVPAEDGGVDLYVATQWLHVDQRQICLALGMPAEKVRLTLAGVGGAFGGREDLSVHVHACLLALRTGKPVKMSYSREESFFGHVHRHPAWMTFEFGAERDGTLVYAKSNVLLDGGAYASSTAAVVGNAGTLGLGPYRFPSVAVDAYGVYTNNPPCGAMRGFGCVQAAFAHEALMDELADDRRHGPGGDPAAQRHARGRPQHHRPGHRLRGAGRRAAADRPRHADAAAGRHLRHPVVPGRGLQHDPRRGRAARRRLLGDLQERRLLRGLRRLLDRPRPAGDDRRRGGGHGAHRGRRGGPGPDHRRAADLPHRAGRGAGRRRPEGHRASGPAARRRRPGRRT